MAILRPDKLGVDTVGMVSVICTTCKLPAWANKSAAKEKKHQARTVCCGTVVQYYVETTAAPESEDKEE